ncbi:unnamed protein product, partial [Pleuronectes platessa]
QCSSHSGTGARREAPDHSAWALPPSPYGHRIPPLPPQASAMEQLRGLPGPTEPNYQNKPATTTCRGKGEREGGREGGREEERGGGEGGEKDIKKQESGSGQTQSDTISFCLGLNRFQPFVFRCSLVSGPIVKHEMFWVFRLQERWKNKGKMPPQTKGPSWISH